jgi:hypothetical protein
MGLFDDFNDLMKDFRDIKNELVDLGIDVVKEIKTEADGVKETIVDTTDEFKDQAKQLQATALKTADGFKSDAKKIEVQFRDAAGLKVPQRPTADPKKSASDDDAGADQTETTETA